MEDLGLEKCLRTGSALSPICGCVLCNCMDGQMRANAGARVASVDGAFVV